MKKIKLASALLAALAITSLTSTAFAEDKEITITGDASCAKCAMHQSDTCQTVVKTTADGKDTLYYLTGKAAKTFHKNICEGGTEKVTVSGKVTEKDGKLMLDATKVEEVKAAK